MTRALLIAALALAQVPTSGVQVRQTAYLKASNTAASDHFGCGGVLQGHTGQGVALSANGTTLAVGSPHKDDAGGAYVFVRAGERWTEQAYLKPSNPQTGASFGHYVALSADGNTLAVSAVWEASNAKGINGNQKDESIPQAGAVYVFTRRGSTWTQQAYIKASNTGEAGTADTFGEGDQFGFSLALSGDGNTLAVGALTEDSRAAGINGDQADNSAASAGAVYVFARTGVAWSQQAYVKPANPDAGDMFGYALSLSADGNTMAVGSFDEDGTGRGVNPPPDNKTGGAGAAYVFTRAGTTWTQQAYIKPSNGETQDSFGVHVALSDDGATLLVGTLDEDCKATGVNAPGCDKDWNDDLSMGAAYVFARGASGWAQQAFLKPSNTGPNDWFGSRLALSGDGNTAAIGAALEDSASTGINGRQDDESASEAGVVYLFRRTGAPGGAGGAGMAWQQQAYIKGSNTKAFDEFGSSVALDRAGTTLVSSARGEDGGAPDTGAVYVFTVSRP